MKPLSREVVIKELLGKPLKVPALLQKEEPAGEWIVIEKNETARIKIIKDSKGNESIPAFTDDEFFQRWMPSGGYYEAFYGRDLFSICVINNMKSIIVNPGSTSSIEIPLEEIKAILDRN